MKKFTFIAIIILLLMSLSLTMAAIRPVVEMAGTFGATSVVVSPDGAVVYVAVSDGTVRKIEAHSGRQVGSITFPKSVRNISLADRGKKLLVISDKLYILDTDTITDIKDSIRSDLPKGATAISGANYGDLAIVLAGSALVYYNTQSGGVIFSVSAPSEQYSVTMDGVSRTVYSGGKDQKIRGFDYDSGKITIEYQPKIGIIHTVAISGKYLLAGGELGAVAINTANGKIIPLVRHTDDVRSVSVTPDSKFAVSGGDDGTAVIWNSSNKDTFKGESIPNIAPTGYIKSVAVDPYFRYVAYAISTSTGEGGVGIQYTANKSQRREIYFYRDASITLNEVGYVDGTGVFGKYLSYESSGKSYAFNEVAHVVHKPENLNYPMMLPKVATSTTSPITQTTQTVDTAPPTITVNMRGLAVVSTSTDLITISGTITDPSGVAWAKVDARPLKLTASGGFSFEIAKGDGRNITIAAADTLGNISEKVVNTGELGSNKVAQKVALLIGVNNYKNLPSLKTPEYDARVVGELLRTKFGYEVRYILGEKATRDAVMTELATLRKSIGAGGSLIIYYAGHGYKDSVTGNAYWQMYDAAADDDTKWILTHQLTSSLDGYNAEQILVVADSCYSGVVTKSTLNKQNRVVITSGGDEPVADTYGGTGHSMFATAFIKSLKSVQSGEEAEKLYTDIIKIFPKNGQKPQYILLSIGKYLL